MANRPERGAQLSAGPRESFYGIKRVHSTVVSGINEDFISAAVRHCRDAEQLLDAASFRSPDQAWHLAGFAHECARKACVRASWVPKMLGHEFTVSSETILDIATSLDPLSGRLPIRDWASRHPAVAAWRPEHRYERTGSRSAQDARALVVSARGAVDTITVALLLQASLEMESVR